MGSPRPLRLAAAITLAAALVPATGAVAEAANCGYDATVLADHPVAYWRMDGAGHETDRSGHGLTGTYSGTRSRTTLPDGDPATDFDGATGYLEVADTPALSPATTGRFTLEAWMRPDTLEFPHSQSSGYVHWMGKGETGQHEYVARMYSKTNTENRPNRISGYAFNLDGGLGAGSYFQDAVVAGQWIHYVLVIDSADKSAEYPYGYTKIYRDGVLRDQDQLQISGTVITPA
ncbi:MAG TPA: LamG-like jellyroll fold domain-containing protein, partial [Actinocatenispora sp.]